MPLATRKPGSVQYLRGVIFGPPKTGKTTFACSGEGKTLLILTEPEGDLSVSNDGVDVVEPKSYADFMTAIKMGAQYDTVVLDSVTFMAEILGGEAIGKAYRENKDPRRAYLKVGTVVNEVVNKLSRIPANVIFITQLRIDGAGEDDVPLNPEEGEYNLTLAVSPMVYKVLAPAVSFLGRTYKTAGIDRSTSPPERVEEYWISFRDFGKSPAGSRIPVPDKIKNPTLDKLRS